MIKVEKDFANAPAILKSESRRLAFDENIARGRYCDKKNSYRSSAVLEALNKIYHKKCAYCEKSLLDDPKHIEHYRPKKIYYWLAYSWDNLLLACGSCNSAKGNRFAVNAKAEYCDEAFENIHALGEEYDKLEKPLIVNPEADDLAHLLTYDKDAVADSSDERVKHTIEVACKLNREELVQLRRVIINNFINRVNTCYLKFEKKRNGLSIFEPTIIAFLDECTIKSEFYTFRCFVVKNIEIFFEDEKIVKILKKFIAKNTTVIEYDTA